MASSPPISLPSTDNPPLKSPEELPSQSSTPTLLPKSNHSHIEHISLSTGAQSLSRSAIPLKEGRKRAQVKHACSNCQQAKTACSTFRPCQYCVDRKIEHTCMIADRKQRHQAKYQRTVRSPSLPTMPSSPLLPFFPSTPSEKGLYPSHDRPPQVTLPGPESQLSSEYRLKSAIDPFADIPSSQLSPSSASLPLLPPISSFRSSPIFPYEGFSPTNIPSSVDNFSPKQIPLRHSPKLTLSDESPKQMSVFPVSTPTANLPSIPPSAIDSSSMWYYYSTLPDHLIAISLWDLSSGALLQSNQEFLQLLEKPYEEVVLGFFISQIFIPAHMSEALRLVQSARSTSKDHILPLNLSHFNLERNGWQRPVTSYLYTIRVPSPILNSELSEIGLLLQSPLLD